MREQMQRLQQQLEASQKVCTPSSTPVRTAVSSAGPKHMTPKPTPPQQLTSKVTQAKPAATTQKIKTEAGKQVVVYWKLLLFHFTHNVQNKLITTHGNKLIVLVFSLSSDSSNIFIRSIQRKKHEAQGVL